MDQIAPNAGQEDRYRLAHSIDHSRLAEVCSWVEGRPGAGRQHTQPIVARLQQHADIRQLAKIVSRLQEERHRADYDHLARFDKVTALFFIEQAERALDLLQQLDGNHDFERFVALIALHTQQLR